MRSSCPVAEQLNWKLEIQAEVSNVLSRIKTKTSVAIVLAGYSDVLPQLDHNLWSFGPQKQTNCSS